MVKKFDPKELAQESKVMHSIVDKDGDEIHYYPLTWLDASELKDSMGTVDYSVKLLHKMLSKAYPELTFEDVQSWPLKKIQMLLDLLLEKQGYITPKEEPTSNVK